MIYFRSLPVIPNPMDQYNNDPDCTSPPVQYVFLNKLFVCLVISETRGGHIKNELS